MDKYKKIVGVLATTVVCLLGAASSVLAHAVVSPSQVGIGSFGTYSLAIPTEKDIPTVGVRLVMPPGLQEVVPDVKAGWNITTKTDANDNVTEIDWTGGTIPVGMRDEFSFSAQAPAQATTLIWKAYQTYKDGSVVAWVQDPSTLKSDDDGSPYSTTKVINDLVASPTPTPVVAAATTTSGTDDTTSLLLTIGVIISIILSVLAVGLHFVDKGPHIS